MTAVKINGYHILKTTGNRLDLERRLNELDVEDEACFSELAEIIAESVKIATEVAPKKAAEELSNLVRRVKEHSTRQKVDEQE